MRAKTILSVLFLISLVVVAMLYLESLPKRANASAAAADEILVATMPLARGTLLRSKYVAWRQNFRPSKPEQISRSSTGAHDAKIGPDEQMRAEVYGAALRVRLAAGDPIRRSDIVQPGDRDFLQIVLSLGERAIAIPVPTAAVITGLLFPGDRVDVILTQIFKNDAPLTRRSVSETVVEDLRVLAIDRANAKQAGVDNGFGHTVTLEVTPQQAEKISVAMELGKLSLTLRGISGTGRDIASTRGPAIKPTWAGDVSPALDSVRQPQKEASVLQPIIEVIHGTKREIVKSQ